MHRVCCPLLLFFSFFPLVDADLFHDDGILVQPRLRRLLTNGDARNVTRSRRGLIDVVGHLSKTLFGTATSRDINKVRRLINMLGNRQEEIVHHVTNLWTLVNKTRSYVRENRVLRKLRLFVLPRL